MPIPAGSFGSTGSGRDADSEPTTASVSANGRYVAFMSDDDDLTPGIEPDAPSIFRKDRTTGAVELISRTTGAGGTALAAVVADPVISNDGNRVAWVSDAAFDPADIDGKRDVYVRDVTAGTTTLATPGTSGSIIDFDLSGDGNWIAFSSTEVLGGIDGNGVSDIFRRNLTTGALALASATNLTATAGNSASHDPSISDNGDWVAFSSQATSLVAGFASSGGTTNVYARRMSTTATVLISAKFDNGSTGGNSDSGDPIVAGQPGAGSSLRVGYTSRATNLADNGVTDASSNDSGYVRQFAITASTLATRADGGAGANASGGAQLTGLSDSPLRATFQSSASNLPGASASSSIATYLRDLDAGTTARISGASGYSVNPSISGDGAFAIWFEAGPTAQFDPDLSGVFGRSLPSGAIELVSRPASGAPVVAAAPTVGTPEPGARTVSGDGRYVVFSAIGAGLGAGGSDQVYRRDLRTNELVLISRATGASGATSSRFSWNGTMSASGGRVAFLTSASLDPADINVSTDVYVRDVDAGTTTLVSRATGPDGMVGNASAGEPSISADGQHVAFRSTATNFGVADGKGHLYVRNLATGTTVLADRATGAGGAIAADGSESPRLSGDGRLVLFESQSANLSPDDPSGTSHDLYVRDLAANTTTLVSRRPGLAGAKLTGSSYYPTISSDGSTVAFKTSDQLAAPEAGPWGGDDQIVVRKIGTGENILASRVAGGAPGDRDDDAIAERRRHRRRVLERCQQPPPRPRLSDVVPGCGVREEPPDRGDLRPARLRPGGGLGAAARHLPVDQRGRPVHGVHRPRAQRDHRQSRRCAKRLPARGLRQLPEARARRGDAGAARGDADAGRAALEGVAHQPAIQGGDESDAAHGQGRPRRRPEEEDHADGDRIPVHAQHDGNRAHRDPAARDRPQGGQAVPEDDPQAQAPEAVQALRGDRQARAHGRARWPADRRVQRPARQEEAARRLLPGTPHRLDLRRLLGTGDGRVHHRAALTPIRCLVAGRRRPPGQRFGHSARRRPPLASAIG